MVRSLIMTVLKSHMGRICICMTTIFVMVLALSVWASVVQEDRGNGRKKPSVTDVRWANGTADEIAVVFTITGSDFEPSSGLPNDLKLIVRQTPLLAEYWEISEASAFFQGGGKRRRVIREGPFPLKTDDPQLGERTRVWTMHQLTRAEYEVVLCLRRIKEGMPFQEVRSAVCEQDALTFSVEPLHTGQSHVRTLL